MLLAWLSPHFQSLLWYPQANWALLVLITGGWACVCSRTLWVPQRDSLVRVAVSPTAITPTAFYTQRFRNLLFLALDPWVVWSVLLCSCSSRFICTRNVGPPVPPAVTLCVSSLPQLPASAPPTSLDECFFFDFLVVELPYSLIFWQFWLFLFLNWLLSFFWFERRQSVSTYASNLLRVRSSSTVHFF